MHSEHQIAKKEQLAHDARINVDLAGEELARLERHVKAQKQTKLGEIRALDEQLETARNAKKLLEDEASRLSREAEAARA